MDHSTHPFRRLPVPIPVPLTLALTLALVACDQADPVRAYDAPRDRRTSDAPAPQAMRSQAYVGDALWAAGVPLDAAWHLIFKTIGPQAAITAETAALQTLVRSAVYDASSDAPPTWEVPAGWTQEKADGSPGQVAVLWSPNRTLKVSISVVGGGKIANIQRWRGQAGQPTLSDADAEATLQTVGLAKTPGTWQVLIEGQIPRPASETSTAPATTEVGYTLPEGWKAVKPANTTRLAQFDAGGDCTVSLSVLPGQIGGQCGDMLGNYNRWLGQVQLPPLEKLPVPLEAVGIPCSGLQGAILPFFGRDRSLMVVFAADDVQTWFIKMEGPPDAVGERLKPFTQFVTALRLPAHGAGTPPPIPLLPVKAKSPNGTPAHE